MFSKSPRSRSLQGVMLVSKPCIVASPVCNGHTRPESVTLQLAELQRSGAPPPLTSHSPTLPTGTYLPAHHYHHESKPGIMSANCSMAVSSPCTAL